MKIILILYFVSLLIGCNFQNEKFESDIKYVQKNRRIISVKNRTYYIDPNIGSDTNIGIEKSMPWKSFKNINKLILTEGNRVEILSSGKFYESLFIIGKGSEENPIEIFFAEGRYDFYPTNALRKKFHISNSNDSPDSLKSIAFYFLDSKNINIKAKNADVIMRGKVIEVCINNCENVYIEGFSFDYSRPTVSEFIVENISDKFADVKVHKDSDYLIQSGKLIWIGEGWQHEANSLWQIFNPKSKEIYRHSIPIEDLHFEEKSKNQLRINFDKNPGFIKRVIYQNRDTFRDYAAVFINESKNITWKNINVYFMHGMGFVNQFSENLIYDSIIVVPRKDSERTSAAWADILHFSSCRGNIEISNSFLSAANDDAINVHGTHLKVTEILSDKKIRVRYMHPQTYGFNAFKSDDSIEFINSMSLLPKSKNIVLNSVMLDEKEIEITFKEKMSKNIQTNDVIENITWSPNFKITNTKITQIPTRGILVTTRGKIIIEYNEFLKTHMSAILIADDANSWFESGYVNDATIFNNKFIECGEPVVNIHPENLKVFDNKYIHKNINVLNNYFQLNNNLAFSVKNSSNILFENNIINSTQIKENQNYVKIENCANAKIVSNYINSTKIN
ncbi:MAG: hypothetical protein IPH62_09550 [Ignavibacteriae bacterium]|nr:hypothetical protein [Ignavibacteriota bacterium]